MSQEQNKELRFLVDTMLKTYDQLNKQIAEELAAGTPIPAKEIMRGGSEELMERFIKESSYDKVKDEPTYIFETRGFAKTYEDSCYRYDDVYKDFLNSFSNDELLEFIDDTCKNIQGIRLWVNTKLNNRLEELSRKESA